MKAWNILVGKGRPGREAYNFTGIYELIVWKM
jgi:hypothetical protein